MSDLLPSNEQPPDPDREFKLKVAELELKREDLVLRQRIHLQTRWTNPVVIAILAAVLTGLLNAWVSQRNAENALILERRKWEQEVQADRDKRLAGSVLRLSEQLAKGHQQVAWLLWKREQHYAFGQAQKDRAEWGPHLVDAYDDAMKAILPSVLSAHVEIAMQDPLLHKRLAPLIEEIGLLDAAVSVKIQGRGSLSGLQNQAGLALTTLGPRISDAYVHKSEANSKLLVWLDDMRKEEEERSRSLMREKRAPPKPEDRPSRQTAPDSR